MRKNLYGKISQYIESLLLCCGDKRVQENIKSMCAGMISNKSVQIYSIAKDSNEYERYKGLIDGALKNGLSVEQINGALSRNSVQKLGSPLHLAAIYDGCDIRKPYAEKLENIGKVRDLDGRFVNGYGSLNTVVLDLESTSLHLLSNQAYSSQDPDYVKVTELKNRADKTLQSYEYNYDTLAKAQITATHESLRQVNEHCVITHLLDRRHDDKSYFEHIEQLGDSFIIRAKVSRNANVKHLSQDNESETYIKLVHKTMDTQFTRLSAKVMFNNKVYTQVKFNFGYETLHLGAASYWVVRVDCRKSDGSKIFKDPVLLITNYIVRSEQMAEFVYRMYLNRNKIEGVFKFLKGVLGWEEFQVRTWESIKNIIALCFFIGGYFYEIESELTNDVEVQRICLLGGSKRKITRYFFLQGLGKIAIAQQVNDFVKEHDISPQDFEAMKKYALL